MGAFPEEPSAVHQVPQPLWEHPLLFSSTRVAVLLLDLVTKCIRVFKHTTKDMVCTVQLNMQCTRKEQYPEITLCTTW